MLSKTILDRARIVNLCICLLTIVTSYLLYGFYFERYEPLAVSLLSGVFTPGMPYNDFFYLAHIFTARLYAFLFTNFPNIPWLSLFQYGYIFISHYILLTLLKRYSKSPFVFAVTSIVVSLFIMEFYIHHVMTRVSFLLSFVSLLKIISNRHQKITTLVSNGFYYFLFLQAVLIRPEPPTITLLVISVLYFVYINSSNLLGRIKKTIVVFWKAGAICFLAILWVSAQIYTSDDFYKKIEPEVEYELAARNNFVPLHTMKNETDSMRYMAIYNGIWGDASTNDAAFLRSLIGTESEQNQFMYLVNNAIGSIQRSASNCSSVVVLNILLFLILLLISFSRGKALFAKAVLMHLSFYSIIFLMSYKVKMVETSLSPLLFSVSTVYLFIILTINIKFINRLLFVGLLSASLYHLFFLKESVKPVKHRFEAATTVNELIANNFAGKSLFIDHIAFDLMFKGFKPFESIQFKGIKKIYLFNSQHMTTVEPYRTYLAKDCDCDPNSYKEYFSYLLEINQRVVFFIDKNSAIFFQEYLSTVHDLDTEWKIIDAGSLDKYEKLYPGLGFYTIGPK